MYSIDMVVFVFDWFAIIAYFSRQNGKSDNLNGLRLITCVSK